MDGGASGLTTSKKSLDLYIAAFSLGEHLGPPVSGDTTHVVMDGRQNWDWLLGGIHTGKDVCRLKNTWETLMNLLWIQMVQVQVAVIFFGANTTSLKDLHGHGTGHDVARSQILSVRSVSLHEAFTLTVSQDATFTTATLGYEATSTIDASGMELNELRVLNGKTSSSNHATTITSASVSTSTGEVRATVTTCGHDSVGGLHPVDGTVSHVVGHDTTALVTLHNEVHGEVLHEEDAVVTKGASEKRVQHGVSRAVSDSAASVCLTTLAVVSGLPTEGSLVDLAFRGSAERHTV